MGEKANQLREKGWIDSCRWVYGNEEGLSDADICKLDLDDVEDCDTLILFTHPRGEPQPGGGRHVEYGYALALGKETIVIGPRENVFINHPNTIKFDSWESFLSQV